MMRMTQASARGRFGRARVARLATVSAAGEPHLVPVTFAVIDPAVTEPGATWPTDGAPPAAAAMIAFAIDHKPKSTTALRRLDNIAGNPRVAFLVDNYDEDWERLWWVRADADADILDGAPRDRALAALAAKYLQYKQVPPTGVVVGAVVNSWSGWQYGGNEPLADGGGSVEP
jgi:PPOX class probable F420-dependent enzyme